MVRRILYISIILLLSASAAFAAPENLYRITYTINVGGDGTAVWNVEYRAPLVSKEDFDSFNNYTRQLKPVYFKEFEELMLSSVSEASNATSRKMVAGGFTEEPPQIQSAPTGTYGVIRYSFTWTNFAQVEPDNKINIGDVFTGGLYLSKDNTLVIQYPSSYVVENVIPQPDQMQDGMVWYGLRSFKAGEPRIILSSTSSPWMPYAIAVAIIAGIIAGIYVLKRGKKAAGGDVSEDTVVNIAEAEMMDLQERIVKLLKDSGGSLYQSEIGKQLGLPKSTVSSALNDLHSKNVVQKIKKGRENLIRLV